jgi:hypothetical protein
MGTHVDPVVGNWYQYENTDQRFVVVAVDEDEATIEIQNFDGDLEELDADTWYELDIEPIETPEDWTGPIDDIERDDLGYTETGMTPADWRPRAAKKTRKPGKSDLYEEEPEDEDDWGEGFPDEEQLGDDED